MSFVSKALFLEINLYKLLHIDLNKAAFYVVLFSLGNNQIIILKTVCFKIPFGQIHKFLVDLVQF